MTPKFNFVVCSIEESKDLDAAANPKGPGRGKGKWKDKNTHHKADENYVVDSNTKGKGSDKKNVECF